MCDMTFRAHRFEAIETNLLRFTSLWNIEFECLSYRGHDEANFSTRIIRLKRTEAKFIRGRMADKNDSRRYQHSKGNERLLHQWP